MEYKRYIFLTVMLLLLSSCATKPHYIEGKVMPKDIDVLVNAIDVQPFRGNYGSQFSSQLETTIKREGFVDVLTNSAPFTLRGNLDIGWIKSDSYLDRCDDRKEERDGKTYTKRVCTYKYRKQGTATANYELVQGNNIVVANHFIETYDNTSSGESSGEAKANALADSRIIHERFLPTLAKKITCAISPCKVTWSFPLKDPRYIDYPSLTKCYSDIKAGVDHFKGGNNYTSAEQSWQKVINNLDDTEDAKCKAMAYYNLGVLKATQNDNADAFVFFEKATRLNPKEELYSSAISKLDKAEYHTNRVGTLMANRARPQKIYLDSTAQTYSSNKYHLTVNTNPKNSIIKIMNIGPKYRDGIALKPGKYKIRVEKRGFNTVEKWVTLSNSDLTLSITLERMY